MRNMVGWLREPKAAETTMEGTGIYWEPPFREVKEAAIRGRLVYAQLVSRLEGRKTDVSHSIWLARVCQFEHVQASHVPSCEFFELRKICRFRRKLVQDGARDRHRIHKTIDPPGLPFGGLLSLILGVSGRTILERFGGGDTAAHMLGNLNHHVHSRIERLTLTLVLRFTKKDRGRVRLSDRDDGRQPPILSDYVSIDGVAVAMLLTRRYQTTGCMAG